MLAEFLRFVKLQQLFKQGEPVLVAVSGGKDSVCLAHLLSLAEFNFSIAHCNFKLRGKESDDDALFVKQFAQDLGVDFYQKDFDTAYYAEAKKISIQEAARELRYTWFRELKEQKKFTKILTAHHQDDSVETFFINLFRSSGISGLTGISAISEDIVRPLLFASRNDIDKHIQTFKLAFREDSSNASDAYLRNKIRHTINPQIKDLDNRSYKGILQSIEFLKNDYSLFQYLLHKETAAFVKKEIDKILIDLALLKQHAMAEALLFQLLKPFGFHKNEINKILKCVQSGKLFYTSSHRALVNRNELIISKRTENDVLTSTFIEEDETEIFYPLKLSIENLENNKIEFSDDKKIAYLDTDKLKWPLEIRKWQAGDSFVPLGMKGRKKVSDFLIDEKVSLMDKENTFVLLSDNELVWLIGYRINNQYKITENTRKVLRLELIPENV